MRIAQHVNGSFKYQFIIEPELYELVMFDIKDVYVDESRNTSEQVRQSLYPDRGNFQYHLYGSSGYYISPSVYIGNRRGR